MHGLKIAFIASDGVEQVDLEHTWEAIRASGGNPSLLTQELRPVRLMNGSEPGGCHEVDGLLMDHDASTFDGLVLPGGLFSVDRLRRDRIVSEFVADLVDDRKPVGAVGHAPWLLIEADAVDGRSLTSAPSLRTDIENAGGLWTDTDVHVDGGLITGRSASALPAFCRALVDAFTADGDRLRAAR